MAKQLMNHSGGVESLEHVILEATLVSDTRNNMLDDECGIVTMGSLPQYPAHKFDSPTHWSTKHHRFCLDILLFFCDILARDNGIEFEEPQP